MRLFRRKGERTSSTSREVAADVAGQALGEILIRGLVAVVKAIAHALT
ncbi:hypothetical protein ACFXHA_13975 [Nocardia sp. NPDC059240]